MKPWVDSHEATLLVKRVVPCVRQVRRVLIASREVGSVTSTGGGAAIKVSQWSHRGDRTRVLLSAPSRNECHRVAADGC